MAVTCLNCGYVMKTNQEFQSAVVKSGYDIVEWIKASKISILIGVAKFVLWILKDVLMSNIFAGNLNSGPHSVKCPNCDATGRWSDH